MRNQTAKDDVGALPSPRRVRRRRSRVRPVLREGPDLHRSDSGDAFIADPAGGPAHTGDDLAEILAESFVASATSAQDAGQDLSGGTEIEEVGALSIVGADEPAKDD